MFMATLAALEARLVALERAHAREIGALNSRVAALEAELTHVKQSRPPAAAIARAFELMAHEISPRANSVTTRQRAVSRHQFTAVLGHAQLLLARSWPEAQLTPGAPTTLCWFANDSQTSSWHVADRHSASIHSWLSLWIKS